MTKTKRGSGSLPLGSITAHFSYVNTISDEDIPGMGTYYHTLYFTGMGDMHIDQDSSTYVKDASGADMLVTWGALFTSCTDELIRIPDTVTALGEGLFERTISQIQARVHVPVAGPAYITYDDVSCYDDHYGTVPIDYESLHYIKRVYIGKHVIYIGARCFSGGYGAYENRYSNYIGNLSTNPWANKERTEFKYWIRSFKLENDVEIKYSASPGITDVFFANPDALEYIGDEAFSGCVDLEYVEINNHTPQYLGERVFASCFKLARINFDRRLPLKSGFFYNCFKLKEFNKHNEIREVDGGCMVGCLSLIEVTFTLDCRLDGQYVKNASIMHVNPNFVTNPSKTKKQITYIHGTSGWPCCRAWMHLDNRTIIYDKGLGRGWPTLYYYNFGRLYRIGLCPQPYLGDNIKRDEYTKIYPYYIEGRIWYATIKPNGDNPVCEVYAKDDVNYRNFFDSDTGVDLGEMENLFSR